jgi:RNA polymerase sigma-70 factor (ECF subfamily)
MCVDLTDAELVLRAKAADHQAISTIYERYAAAIYRYIYYRISDVDLAEDIRADVFLRMLEGLDRYEDRGWPLSAWLYRIAHDRTIDTLRRHRARSLLPLESWNGTSDGPEIMIDLQLDREELLHTINQLTDDQRQVIQMRFLQEMSLQEVAHALGRTEGAVKALQHRGIQALARHLHRAMY